MSSEIAIQPLRFRFNKINKVSWCSITNVDDFKICFQNNKLQYHRNPSFELRLSTVFNFPLIWLVFVEKIVNKYKKNNVIFKLNTHKLSKKTDGNIIIQLNICMEITAVEILCIFHNFFPLNIKIENIESHFISYNNKIYCVW